MSNDLNRRRRRTGSSSARFKSSLPPAAGQASPVSVHKPELAASAAVCVVAFALIALIWIVTMHAVQDQRVATRDRAEQVLAGQAATIAETVGHELLMIDQSLSVLQAAWKNDSDTFDILKWQQKMPALLDVADDLMIADEKQIIRRDILPKAVGQGVGAAYVTFPHGSLEQFRSDGTEVTDSLLVQPDTATPIDARHFLMYIIRPLDHPKGWLIGASYRSQALTKLFAEAVLGYNAVVALVDTQKGMLEAVVGPAARRPKTNLSQTGLFEMLGKSSSGVWRGDMAIDQVERLHAFHRVANRDMAVVVAADWSDVMAPADELAAGAQTMAAVGSVLVLTIGGIIVWAIHTRGAGKRRKRTFERNRTEIERLRADEASLTARMQVASARFQTVLDHISDGVAVFDANLRLVQWNDLFLYGSGVPLRQEMPLDTLLRDQVAAGLVGMVADPETEIARRAGLLRIGDLVGVSHAGPGGEVLVLRGLAVADGGLVLLLNSKAPGREMTASILNARDYIESTT